MSTRIKQFIAHFVAERKRLGLTQAVAAQKCGVSLKMWGNYERGEHVPTGEVLLNFQEIGANVTSLFLLEDEAHPAYVNQGHVQYIADAGIEALIKAYEIADESGKEALLTIADLIKKTSK